jgi:hypothetical protein
MDKKPIISKFLTIIALYVTVVLFSECCATWKLSEIASRSATLAVDTQAPSEMIGEALLTVEALGADIELLTITQTMAANELAAGAIATNRAQFMTLMDEAEALTPGEFSKIEALKVREDALLHQACRRSLLKGAAAISPMDNVAAQTEYLAHCAPLVRAMVHDMVAEQNRIQAQAAASRLALREATNLATAETLAIMLGSLGLVTLCGVFLFFAWVASPLERWQRMVERRSGA